MRSFAARAMAALVVMTSIRAAVPRSANLSHRVHSVGQLGLASRSFVATPADRCTPFAIRRGDEHSPSPAVVDRLVVPIHACAAVIGRGPQAWARTSMVSGRPAQFVWSSLQRDHLPRLLGPLPNNWRDVRPVFSFVDTSCVVKCTFEFTMLIAAAALDALTDPRFGRQRVVVPVELAHHHPGDCVTMIDVIEGIESERDFTDEGRIDAMVDTLDSVLGTQVGLLQCT